MAKKKSNTSTKPSSPVQHTVYTVGCEMEAMHTLLARQLRDQGVPDASEVALVTLKQAFSNAILSIQTTNQIQTQIQMNQPTRLVGFNRG